MGFTYKFTNRADNDVQRRSGLQNIVLPNIYYTIRETHCHLIGDPTIFILDPRFSLTSQGLSSETPTFSLETLKSIIGDIKSFIVDTESFIVDTKSFIVDTKSFIVDPRFLLETLRCSQETKIKICVSNEELAGPMEMKSSGSTI